MEYIFRFLVLYKYVPQKPLRHYKYVWRFYYLRDPFIYEDQKPKGD